jgi:hypothetical protein
LRELEPALARLDLMRFDGGLLDLPDAPRPPADTLAPVRFLPTWDATLLVHARRAGILPEPYRARIFHTRMPQSLGTFLVGGAVAGTWRPDGTVEPFARLDRATRRAVDDEAERLRAFTR